MLKLDNSIIEDRFKSASFNFYTDEEIEKISVKKIINPNPFDHLNNPNDSGIYDKAMGVSPFDHRSQCVTCGLDCNFCPGHVGHLELTAPCYNPFLINTLYKLMKSKCISCHRLRIHPRKIDIYVMCLKLIKSGEVVAAQNVKQYFMNAAKTVHLVKSEFYENPKKLSQLRDDLNKIVLRNISEDKNKTVKNPQVDDVKEYFKALEEKFDSMHSQYQDQIQAVFQQVKLSKAERGGDKDKINTLEVPYNPIDKVQYSTLAQKFLKEVIHEVWGAVITTVCPHCQAKSPAIRKDGYTKFFQKALSEKLKNQMIQQERLRKHSQNTAGTSQTRDDGFEIITTASTSGGGLGGSVNSRKTSQAHTNESFQEVNEEQENDDEEEENEGEGGNAAQKYLTPIEVKDQLERLWRQERELLSLMYGKYCPVKRKANGEEEYYFKAQSLGPQMFFLNKLIVPPNRFRPESQGAFGGAGGQGDRSYLHAHAAMLTKVLVANLKLKDALLVRNELKQKNEEEQKLDPSSEVVKQWIILQDSINTFMDSSMAQKMNDREQTGIRQMLERKEGMFRMKMMGKRVNFGARSVISPDPYITTDQIGVPVFMARKLTFPEQVAEATYERLKKMVINGAHQHPGANIIEDLEKNTKIHLDTLSANDRKSLAKMLKVGKKVVYRHLVTGDVLLVNRQPTLHKPSIMAHIARILPKEQTIRMHYSNCSTYNADFDGDEMNLHFPQSYLAQSEARNIMATHKQYIVPTSGKPIRGLIQDSVVSGVYLSSKDTFISKEVYQQLVYVGLNELFEQEKLQRVFTLQPAILKPKPLYTGKQVISTILKNIVNLESDYKQNQIQGMNLDSKAKLSAKEWGKIGAEEGDVVIRDNELLQGTMDKAQFGASEFGMVHSFYEIYGSKKAGELLTSLGRIFTVFLQMHGFTCGLDDLLLTPEFNQKRRQIIEESHKEGIEAAAKFCGLKNYVAKQFNYSNRVVFQKKFKSEEIEKFNQMALPENPFKNKQTIQLEDPIRKRLDDKFAAGEDNQKIDTEFDNVIKSKVNNATSQVLKICIPDGLLKRFPKNNISAMVLTGAKGGIVNMTQITCMLGQQELEGKRVPKMQNGKTLPCFLPYDPNPRSSGYVSDRFIDGLRPQDFFFHCMAGREGLIDTAVKTSRSGYLQRCLIKQMETLIVQYDMTVRDNDGSIIQFLYGDDSIDVIHNKFLDKMSFLEQNFTSLITSYNASDIMSKVDTTKAEKLKYKNKKYLKQMHKKYPQLPVDELKKTYSSDPVLSSLNPLKYFGSISEKMEDKLKYYMKNDSMGKLQEKLESKALKTKYKSIQPETFQKMYFLKYMNSLVHPGENVGTIAAQSVGEPSTQMTLNTFHLAGHGAENMTLGIPRLKEILMTAPIHIKTPSMNIYFRKDKNFTQEQLEKTANKFKRLKLSDIVKEVKVMQSLNQDLDKNFSRVYKITLKFEDHEKIKKSLGIKFKKILQVFTDQFIPLLMNEALRQLRRAAQNDRDLDKEEAKSIISKTTPMKGQAQKSKNNNNKKQKNENDEEKFLEQEEELMKKDNSSRRSSNKGKKDDIDGEEEDEEEDEEEKEFNMEIDGAAKKQQLQSKIFEQQEEDDDEKGGEEIKEEDEEKYDELCNVFKEQYSKFFGYVKKVEYEKNQSCSVLISFPLEFKKVLMITVAENILGKILVRSIPGIEKCTLITASKPGEESFLYVSGLNFDAFCKHPEIFDVRRIQSNDIMAIKAKYGIEAARSNLVKEIRSVFNMYGIEVNYRHLSLIADFITFNGEYRPFNRIGMEESSSPFLKMSFETTMKYLISSCMTQDTDNNKTPSSSLVMGTVPKVGTGIFEVHDIGG